MDGWTQGFIILGKIFVILLIWLAVILVGCFVINWIEEGEEEPKKQELTWKGNKPGEPKMVPKYYPMYDSKGKIIERRVK